MTQLQVSNDENLKDLSIKLLFRFQTPIFALASIYDLHLPQSGSLSPHSTKPPTQSTQLLIDLTLAAWEEKMTFFYIIEYFLNVPAYKHFG